MASEMMWITCLLHLVRLRDTWCLGSLQNLSQHGYSLPGGSGQHQVGLWKQSHLVALGKAADIQSLKGLLND